MSKHAHEQKRPASFGEAVRERAAEILGFVLLVSLGLFVFLNKTYNLI